MTSEVTCRTGGPRTGDSRVSDIGAFGGRYRHRVGVGGMFPALGIEEKLSPGAGQAGQEGKT